MKDYKTLDDEKFKRPINVIIRKYGKINEALYREVFKFYDELPKASLDDAIDPIIKMMLPIQDILMKLRGGIAEGAMNNSKELQQADKKLEKIYNHLIPLAISKLETEKESKQ